MPLSKYNLARIDELYFVRHIIFTISLREIVKMMCLTKKIFCRRRRQRTFYTTPIEIMFCHLRSAGNLLHSNPIAKSLTAPANPTEGYGQTSLSQNAKLAKPPSELIPALGVDKKVFITYKIH